MILKKLADDAVEKIQETVSVTLSEADAGSISRIIEDTLIEAVRETSKSCTTAAVVCCGPEADIAHKIAEGVEQARRTLIANLMGPR